MRNISFQLTTDQIRNRTKTVTRRLGWLKLKAGDLLQGCVKCQGLRPGEKIEKLAVIEVVSVRREPLESILFADGGETAREGFPMMGRVEFVKFFCDEMKCEPETEVTRIEFKYL
jgi:hypothetical protein